MTTVVVVVVLIHVLRGIRSRIRVRLCVIALSVATLPVTPPDSAPAPTPIKSRGVIAFLHTSSETGCAHELVHLAIVSTQDEGLGHELKFAKFGKPPVKAFEEGSKGIFSTDDSGARKTVYALI